MAAYITPDELRDYIGSDTTNFQSHVEACCTVASRKVEEMCDRIFIDVGTTTRYFEPDDYFTCEVDDFSSTAGLTVAVDSSYDGTYATTLNVNSDFVVEPINQDRAGLPWPYTTLRMVGLNVTTNAFFPPPLAGRRYTVKVTTTHWGWAVVPDEIKLATKIAGAWLFKMKDAPDGFIGLDGWGPRMYKENPAIQLVLHAYMKNPISVA